MLYFVAIGLFFEGHGSRNSTGKPHLFMQMFTLQGVQKDTVPFILSFFHHQIKCHFNTSQQAGHVFECKLASAGHRQYSCIIFKKTKKIFPIHGFQSTYCGFTPLATICNNTDGALTEHFCLANFATWTLCRRNSLYSVCVSVCVHGHGHDISFL